MVILPIFIENYLMTSSNAKLIKTIPERISDSEVLTILKTKNWKYVNMVKEYTNLGDELLSDWLNVSVKTFRNYRKQDSELKENYKEQSVLLISLFKHGIYLFGNHDNFYEWLTTDNLYLDGEQPINFLKTITGIRFIDDRLTAMEYGDNV